MKRVYCSILVASYLLTGCGTGNTEVISVASTEYTSKESTILMISDTELKSEKQKILDAINQARSIKRDCHDGRGLVGPVQPLTWNNKLYLSAYEHSYDMANSDTFSHYGSGTEYDITASEMDVERSYFYERIIHNGYTDYVALGENIAGGHTTLEDVMKAWLNSPTHCANIMNGNFSEVGVAIVMKENSNFRIYWTQNFGTKDVD